MPDEVDESFLPLIGLLQLSRKLLNMFALRNFFLDTTDEINSYYSGDDKGNCGQYSIDITLYEKEFRTDQDHKLDY